MFICMLLLLLLLLLLLVFWAAIGTIIIVVTMPVMAPTNPSAKWVNITHYSHFFRYNVCKRFLLRTFTYC